MKESVKEKIAFLKRDAWKPATENRKSSLASSKFGGIPWLFKNEGWPLCKNCNNPLQLFLQLNLAHLPALLQGSPHEGLLQLFYCTNQEPHCESECEAFFPFSKSVLVRIIEGDGESFHYDNSPVQNAFSEVTITGWNHINDYPTEEEIEEHGVTLSEDEYEKLYELGFPVSGEKITGLAVMGSRYGVP